MNNMCGHFSSQEKIYALLLMLEKYYTHYEVKEQLESLIKELKDDRIGIVDIKLENTPEGSTITYVLSNGKSKTITVKSGQKGDKGDRGEQGPQGEPGPVGQRGPLGLLGPQGLQGPKGDKGDTGLLGEQGPKGDRGEIGPRGQQGIQGEQGVQGIQGQRGPQGLQGEKGEPFAIYRTYSSVNKMNLDSTVPAGKFVLIASDVEDPDNAKLYVRTDYGYSFMTDMSGAKGILGPKGELGPQGIQGPIGPQGILGIQGIQGESGKDYILTETDKSTIASLVTNSVVIPTKTSQLQNDSNFLTQHQTLKTINGESIVGSGNIEVKGVTDFNDLENKPNIPTKTSDLTNDSNFVKEEDIENYNTSSSVDEAVEEGVLFVDAENVTFTKKESFKNGSVAKEISDISRQVAVNTQKVSELGLKIDNVEKKVVGDPDVEIDLASMPTARGIISATSGNWASTTSSNYQHRVVDVSEGQKYKLERINNQVTYYALLKTYTNPNMDESAIGTTPDYVNGTNITLIPASGTTITIPSDAKYLYVTIRNGASGVNNVIPKVTKLGSGTGIDGRVKRLEDAIENISVDTDNVSHEGISQTLINKALDDAATNALNTANSVKEILDGEPDIEIDLSAIDWSRGDINVNTKVWENTSKSGYHHIAVPVTEGESYKLERNPTISYYAFLKSYIVPDIYKNPGNEQEGKTPEFAVDGVPYIPVNGVEFDIPSGCNYLYILTRSNSNDYTVKLTKKGKKSPIVELEKGIEGLDVRVTKLEEGGGKTDSKLKGKILVWYGTSIPAGQDSFIENSYPNIISRKTGAIVYNEAKSESGIASRFNIDGTPVTTAWKSAVIHLGNTCANNLDVIHDMYVFDDVNHTVSYGARTKYTGSYPTSLDYDTARATRERYVCMSYEIKIVARYLISDPVEHEAYLRRILGVDYDSLMAYNNGEAFSYRGKPDMFVFDHGCNDGRAWRMQDIGQYDMTRPVGAMENMFLMIRRYCPKAQIVISCFYDNYTLAEKKSDGLTYYKIGEVFDAIASRWQFPLVKLYELFPFRRGENMEQQSVQKVLTRGYWDDENIWHDEGFEWSENGESYTTNLNKTNSSGNPLSGCTTTTKAKAAINPQQIDGVWYWEAWPNQLWMLDNIHPTSDRTWRCSDYMAKVILGQLEIITELLSNP